MKLVKFRNPNTGNLFFVNPDCVISLTDQRLEGGIGIHLTDCTDGKDDYYLCDCDDIEDVARKLETDSMADAISKSMHESFGGGSNYYPAFLEAIAMSLGFGKDGDKSVLNTISKSLDGISSSLDGISDTIESNIESNN